MLQTGDFNQYNLDPYRISELYIIVYGAGNILSCFLTRCFAGWGEAVSYDITTALQSKPLANEQFFKSVGYAPKKSNVPWTTRKEQVAHQD